jgi:hypothetical protein
MRDFSRSFFVQNKQNVVKIGPKEHFLNAKYPPNPASTAYSAGIFPTFTGLFCTQCLFSRHSRRKCYIQAIFFPALMAFSTEITAAPTSAISASSMEGTTATQISAIPIFMAKEMQIF